MPSIQDTHRPVLLREAMDFLAPAEGGLYIDGTLGIGGHAREILRLSSPTGRLVGIEWDEDALHLARLNLNEFGDRAIYLRENFRNIRDVMGRLGLEHAEGVILDLGVSSIQLDDPERGFSFQRDGPLDMRMDRRRQMTAAEIVNNEPPKMIARILREYGEETWAGKIARAIDRERKKSPLNGTARLAAIVSGAIPRRFHPKKIHPATKTFMALRMAVNEENANLRYFLDHVVDCLTPGGRIVFISFHSLEDLVVKQFLRREKKGCICPPDIPQCNCGRVPTLKILTARPIVPSREEVNVNPRSRSARLRAAERL